LSGIGSSEKELSTSEIAKILNVSVRTIYRWIEDDGIIYSRTGTGRYRFPESELNRILKERKDRKLDRINEDILRTVKSKKVAYLRELKVTLEDYFLHEDVTDALANLEESGSLNTKFYEGNRWYFPNNVSWDEVKDLSLHKKELMGIYIDHPRSYARRGVSYDDYSEMLVEDALIKTEYTVVAKNSHYFNGKEYHQTRTSGRKSDVDYIAYVKAKDVYVGIQIKNRLEYPRLDDVHLLLDICRTLDLVPVLVTRLSHPRIYAVFEGIRGEVIQFKRYLLQPPFPRDAFREITEQLRIPLGVYQWVPDFLLSDFRGLAEEL